MSKEFVYADERYQKFFSDIEAVKVDIGWDELPYIGNSPPNEISLDKLMQIKAAMELLISEAVKECSSDTDNANMERLVLNIVNHELAYRQKVEELAQEKKAREQAEKRIKQLEIQKSPFSAMLQGTGTNKLAQTSTRNKKPNVNTITGVATIMQDNHMTIIKNFNALRSDLRISTHKLLDTCIMALTAQNNYRGTGKIETKVTIPLREYAAMLGKPLTENTLRDFRKRVKEDLDILFNISLEWKEQNGTNTKDYFGIRLLESRGIKNNTIIVGFASTFAEYLVGAYIMQYPNSLLQVDERNPSTYHLGRKLALHHSIDNNQRKGTASIIGVQTLLNVCPDIPTYEEVMTGDRAIERRIKMPFENALNSLVDTGVLEKWEYSNFKGMPLSDEQLVSNSYEDFIALYINFTVKDFPDPTPRLERQAEETKKTSHKKKATSKRKVETKLSVEESTNKKYLNRKQAIEILNITKGTLSKWIKAGKIQESEQGILESDILAWKRN